MAQRAPISGASLRLLRDTVFVTDMERGIRRTKGGIILTDDNMKDWGIRPRWGRVWKTGPDVKEEDLKPGQWVLVEHGRWTLAIDMMIDDEMQKVWRIEYPAAVLLIADEPPTDFELVNLADARERVRMA